jgi:hypothetical protein
MLSHSGAPGSEAGREPDRELYSVELAMITNVPFWVAFAVLVAYPAALARWPIPFARGALVRVAKGVTLSLPAAVAALIVRPQGGAANYRSAPPRILALASLPGPEQVTLEDDVLRFIPDRNWILARPRKPLATTFLRVEVSWTEGGLVMQARRLPGEAMLLLLATVYCASLHGPLLHHPLSLSLVVAAIVGGSIGEHNRARRCFDAAVGEANRRIAAVDPSWTPTPATAQATEGIGLSWTCACGKVNEKHRNTCRRCWAFKPKVS